MPLTFTCDSARSNGAQQIVFSIMRTRPNYAYFKIEPEVAQELFSTEVRAGDVWAFEPKLISRAGQNGKDRV